MGIQKGQICQSFDLLILELENLTKSTDLQQTDRQICLCVDTVVEYLGDSQKGLDGTKLIPRFSWYISTYNVGGPGGVLALGGNCFLNIYNNQMEVGIQGGLYIGEDARLGWNLQGVTAPLFWPFN